MTLSEAIEARHSVRRYTNQKIEGETLTRLQETISACNKDSGMHIQLCLNEPYAFSGMMAKYGRFNNANNYIALIANKTADIEETYGYYGQKIVLEAQRLGLNTCWVAMSYRKGKIPADIRSDEKLYMVISIGYGEDQGKPHKSKPLEALCPAVNLSAAPDWFQNGMKAAQLAPTAMNQQKFSFAYSGNKVTASPGKGFYTKVDLGIAKYHFEVGADNPVMSWSR
ncbi:MAG: nitroreductase family protein [Lachnospiraceae bacterium]